MPASARVVHPLTQADQEEGEGEQRKGNRQMPKEALPGPTLSRCGSFSTLRRYKMHRHNRYNPHPTRITYDPYIPTRTGVYYHSPPAPRAPSEAPVKPICPPIGCWAGRLSFFRQNWELLTKDKWVLSTIISLHTHALSVLPPPDSCYGGGENLHRSRNQIPPPKWSNCGISGNPRRGFLLNSLYSPKERGRSKTHHKPEGPQQIPTCIDIIRCLLTNTLDLAMYMLLSLIQSDTCNLMVTTVTMPHVTREQEKYACLPPPL